jgi:hypothetical protein
MSAPESSTLPSPSGELPAFWWGWIASPVWWLVQFQFRYAAVAWACAHGQRWIVLGFGALALAGSVALALWAWRFQRTFRREQQPSSFLTCGAAWITTGFALLVLAQMLPDFFLDPCRE